MKRQIMACLWVALFSLVAGQADAAIWEWGCQGQLGQQLVIFGSDALYVTNGSPEAGNSREAIRHKLTELENAKTSGYTSQNGDAFESKTLEFTREGDAKKKTVLTELSSRRLFYRARMICGRDEITARYRKIYRYTREDEPAHNITMQCFEYQLSTRGGRKGCGD